VLVPLIDGETKFALSLMQLIVHDTGLLHQIYYQHYLIQPLLLFIPLTVPLKLDNQVCFLSLMQLIVLDTGLASLVLSVKPTIALVTPVKYTLLSTVPFAFKNCEAVPPVVLKPLALHYNYFKFICICSTTTNNNHNSTFSYLTYF
jgi:hypothetical protein